MQSFIILWQNALSGISIWKIEIKHVSLFGVALAGLRVSFSFFSSASRIQLNQNWISMYFPSTDGAAWLRETFLLFLLLSPSSFLRLARKQKCSIDWLLQLWQLIFFLCMHIFFCSVAVHKPREQAQQQFWIIIKFRANFHKKHLKLKHTQKKRPRKKVDLQCLFIAKCSGFFAVCIASERQWKEQPETRKKAFNFSFFMLSRLGDEWH